MVVSLLALTACNFGERRLGSEYYPKVYFSEAELPIAEAIWDGNGEELERLIRQGEVDINLPGMKGWTYLYYAVYIWQYDMVEILLKNGADPNVISPSIYTPGAGDQSEPSNESCIETVCYYSYDIKYLKLLLKYGADINESRSGLPLSRAIDGYYARGGKKKINFLLKNGADPNVIAEHNLTPIIIAADVRRWELVHKFLDAGADPFLEVEGSSLKRSIEYYINSSEGTPAWRREIRALMRRLQDMGMEFDFSKAKIKMED